METKKKELTPRQKAYAQEALARAQSSASIKNDLIVIEEFSARGIDEDEITPRENVLTFWGWKVKNRYVKKGEHGVKVTTWIPRIVKDKETGEEKKILRPKDATVFHVTQTAPYGEPVAVKVDARFSEAAREELESPVAVEATREKARNVYAALAAMGGAA